MDEHGSSRERGPWPGLTRESVAITTTTEQRLQSDLNVLLESGSGLWAIRRLVDAGCERAVLVRLVERIHRSQDWAKISRNDLTDAVTTLKKARSQVRLLQGSQLGRAIFMKLEHAEELIAELTWVIDGAQHEQARASAKEAPRSNSAWRDLIEYVHRVTGQFHDEEVSTLITISLEPSGREVTAENLRQWRKRHGLTSLTDSE